MSSFWALGDRAVLGLSSLGQGAKNLLHARECVLNFPSSYIWQKVESIARATGRNPVPPEKAAAGYEYISDKFSLGSFTAVPSQIVKPPRIAECPIQFEAVLVNAWDSAHAAAEDPKFHIVETRIVRVHAHLDVVMPGTNYIDTARWNPLLYVFRHYFGVGSDLGRTFKAEQ
jgi:flavin reductase (DIM6/NTAB) family NADH-FMN oxidoreductase RutF